MPKWTNVRKVEKVEVSENITPAEKTETFNFSNLKVHIQTQPIG